MSNLLLLFSQQKQSYFSISLVDVRAGYLKSFRIGDCLWLEHDFGFPFHDDTDEDKTSNEQDQHDGAEYCDDRHYLSLR